MRILCVHFGSPPLRGSRRVLTGTLQARIELQAAVLAATSLFITNATPVTHSYQLAPIRMSHRSYFSLIGFKVDKLDIAYILPRFRRFVRWRVRTWLKCMHAGIVSHVHLDLLRFVHFKFQSLSGPLLPAVRTGLPTTFNSPGISRLFHSTQPRALVYCLRDTSLPLPYIMMVWQC